MRGYKHKPEDYVPINSRLRFVKRTVVKSGLSKAIYLCQCGTFIERYMGQVKRGMTKSCGCYSVDYPSRYVHGVSNNSLYRIWCNIISRCYDKKSINYHNYGERGVFMCDDWLKDPKLFIDWAIANGWKKGLQVDKDIKSKELGISPAFYSPDTCSIVTQEENLNCTRASKFVTYNGVTQTLSQWGKQTGIPRNAIRYRLRLNWTIESALTVKTSRSHSGRRNNKRKQFKCE